MLYSFFLEQFQLQTQSNNGYSYNNLVTIFQNVPMNVLFVNEIFDFNFTSSSSPSLSPTTLGPTLSPTYTPTLINTTKTPSTFKPTTLTPTTLIPTHLPTTLTPTTLIPTHLPTTKGPTTLNPTTLTPTVATTTADISTTKNDVSNNAVVAETVVPILVFFALGIMFMLFFKKRRRDERIPQSVLIPVVEENPIPQTFEAYVVEEQETGWQLTIKSFLRKIFVG